MANIGDLLGNLDLSAFQEEPDDAHVDQPAPHDIPDNTPDSPTHNPATATTATDSQASDDPAAPSGATPPTTDPASSIPLTPAETAMAAVLSETNLDPQCAHPSLNLRDPDGLDLDTLGLYAVVATIERDLRIQIPDADVAAWVTLDDLLGTVGTLSHT